MTKKERLWSLMIPVEKRLPKIESPEEAQTDILIWIPPHPQLIPNGKFYIVKAGFFVMQLNQLKDHPDMQQKLDDAGNLFHSEYYATHWTRLMYETN